MHYLSKRETQIMEAVYRLGRATVAEVLETIADPPTYSSIRAQLRILEDKGHLVHEELEGKYVYLPTEAQSAAATTALGRVIDTFFKGSVSQTVAALLDSRDRLGDDEIAELEHLIAQAKKEGR